MNAKPAWPRQLDSIPTPDSLPLQVLLRRNDPAHRVASWQYDAAMIHLGLWASRRASRRQACLFHQRPAACGTPVPHNFLPDHCPALAANAFHTQRLPDRAAIPAK